MISEDGGFVKALKDFVRARMEQDPDGGDHEWGAFVDECFGWTSVSQRQRVWEAITEAEMDWPTTNTLIVPVLVGWYLGRPE